MSADRLSEDRIDKRVGAFDSRRKQWWLWLSVCCFCFSTQHLATTWWWWAALSPSVKRRGGRGGQNWHLSTGLRYKLIFAAGMRYLKFFTKDADKFYWVRKVFAKKTVRYASTLVTHTVENPSLEAKEVAFNLLLPDTAFVSRWEFCRMAWPVKKCYCCTVCLWLIPS